MIYKNDNNVNNNSYINKDFQSLWQELLELIPKLTDKWVPKEANESDPLAVLLKVLAIYSDKLNYNIDKSILERFPQTLTQLKNAKNVYDVLGYKAPWYEGAGAKLSFTYISTIEDSSEEDSSEGYGFYIPRFTQFCDSDKKTPFVLVDSKKIFFNKEDYLNPLNRTKQGDVIQGKINNYSIAGVERITSNNLDSYNRLYFTESNVAENGIFVSLSGDFTDSDKWEKVDNIYQATSSYAYEFNIDPVSGACYIEFPDDISNTIGEGIYIKYIVTDGSNGNVNARSITSFFDTDPKGVISTEGDSTYYNTDNIPSSVNTILLSNILSLGNTSAINNGKNPATIDEMYKNYKRVQNTFDTLVTLLDYENYIYRYKKQDGLNVVSNIRVSDRKNDLYDSYKVWALTTSQEVLKNKVYPTSSDDSSPSMGARDIKFYPLNPIPSKGIQNKQDYDNTFKNDTFISEGEANINTFGDPSIEANNDSLISITNNTKVINTDINSMPQNIITIDSSISGEIYLNYKVSNNQAKEIKKNVDKAIYQAFNTRELEFGEPLDYNKVLTTIQNADDRISYVGLNPINYGNINLPNDIKIINGVDDSSSGYSGSLKEAAIKQRAIFNGNTPWTSFNRTFTYKPNQIGGIPAGYEINDSQSIQIESKINISGTGTNYKILPNENLVAFAPQYIDKTTYSNYLYYVIQDNGSTSTSDPILSKDTPEELSNNIYFYETREAAQRDFQLQGSDPITYNFNPSNYKYKIDLGKTVRANFDVYFKSYNNQYSNPYSLNNGDSISVIGYNQNSLTGDNQNIPIKWITNSDKLLDALTGDNITWDSSNDKPTEYAYTLMTGEYFLYSIPGESAFTLLGEGNTIGATDIVSVDENITSKWFSPKTNWDAITEGYDQDTLTWADSPDGSIFHYRQNQIYIFGEGYDIKNLSGTSPIKGDGTIFELGNNFTYTIDNETQSLPSLLEGDKWRGFFRLEFSLSNINGFTLLKEDDDSTSGYLGHDQEIKVSIIDNSSSTSTEYKGSDAYPTLQSNLYISSPGNTIVKLTKDLFGEDTTLYIRNYLQNNMVGSQNFYIINAESSYTIPGNGSTEVAVFAMYSNENSDVIKTIDDSSLDTLTNANTVYYIISKGGLGIKPTKQTYISNISLAPLNDSLGNNTKYGWYNHELTDLIDSDTSFKILDLGDKEFNPTHLIEDESLIKNPIDNISFFNKNHPVNRYVLPKIVSLDELKINEFSIKQ